MRHRLHQGLFLLGLYSVHGKYEYKQMYSKSAYTATAVQPKWGRCFLSPFIRLVNLDWTIFATGLAS